MAIAAAAVLVGAGVVALGLAGNAGNDGDGDPVSSGGGRAGERDDEPAPDLTLDDLEPALLTIDDVPDGYVEDDDDSGDEGDDGSLAVDDVETDPACREALEQLEGSGPDQGAEGDEDDGGVLTAELERPDDEASVTHDLRLAAPGDPTVGEIADLLRECESVSYEADEAGTQVEMRMSVDEVDGLGDDAIAVDIELAIESAFTLEIRSHGLIWSRDGAQSNVSVTGPIDAVTMEGGEPDRELARAVAEAVDERIGEATGG